MNNSITRTIFWEQVFVFLSIQTWWSKLYYAEIKAERGFNKFVGKLCCISIFKNIIGYTVLWFKGLLKIKYKIKLIFIEFTDTVHKFMSFHVQSIKNICTNLNFPLSKNLYSKLMSRDDYKVTCHVF